MITPRLKENVVSSYSGIFEAAVKLPADRRAAFLDQACGGNAELRREIDSLLRAHDAARSIPRERPEDFQPTVVGAAITERPGTVIGPYRLMEQIGEPPVASRAD